jgi:hypothetical protein
LRRRRTATGLDKRGNSSNNSATFRGQEIYGEKTKTAEGEAAEAREAREIVVGIEATQEREARAIVVGLEG